MKNGKDETPWPATDLALIALVSAAVALVVQIWTPLRVLDGAAADLRVAFLAPKAREPIVIAAIDEASIAAMQATAGADGCACRSPISEAYVASIISNLDRKGVRAIGVDLVLDSSPRPADRAVLQDTLRRIEAPVVLLRGSDEALFAEGARARAADPALGRIDDFDAVLRVHAPQPAADGTLSLPAALADVAGIEEPTEPFRVRWRTPQGEARAFAVYPAHVLADAPDGWLRDAIVLVGRMETDPEALRLVEDQHLTPMRLRRLYAAGMDGVEGHAHVLAQMLAGDRIRDPGPWGLVLLTLLASVAGVLAGRLRNGWRVGLGAIVVGLGLYASVAIAAYATWALLLPAAGPAIGFVLAFIVANRVLAARLDRERRFLERAFAHYLAPEVISDMVRAPERLALTAERRDISVLATDLQGFSRLATHLPPEMLGRIMNAYFDGMITILWRHGAMIDKLIGDAILAVFGAPAPMPDHARRAVVCARELDAFAQNFQATSQERFGVSVGATRIGVESGEALVGNFGGALRFDYTAFGEVVVRAARLQAANKGTDGRVLIGATAAAQSGDDRLESVGALDLAGLDEKVSAFRPV